MADKFGIRRVHLSCAVVFSLSLLALPLMLGSRDMAFPRLNAFSYWVFLFAGLFLQRFVGQGAGRHGGFGVK